jgi:hypothetical protein
MTHEEREAAFAAAEEYSRQRREYVPPSDPDEVYDPDDERFEHYGRCSTYKIGERPSGGGRGRFV